MTNERHSQRHIEELKERKRQAAERLRSLLHDLGTAELAFENAARELEEALKDTDAA